MSQGSIKNKVVSSLFWKLFERGGVQVIQFIVSIVIARLLTPSEYGIIALITVFVTIATVFVQSGLGTALIQKKDVNETDFSSVFYYSIFIAFILYLLLFFAAPYIAGFYNMPQLTIVLRVMSLTLFPGAYNSIQNAVVSRKMEFKKLFISSVGAVILSGVIGILMAWMGFGVWALVGQQLSYQVTVSLIMTFTVKWRPQLKFSYKNTSSLLKYGSKLLGARLIDTIYHNLESLFIGKKYSSDTLAFFNKGKQFPLILIDNIDGSIQSVMLPAFSAKQSNIEEVKSMIRRTISLSTYLVFPAMIGLAVVGKPLIMSILGEEWLMCVPFLQAYCLISALFPLQTVTLQAINAIGRSDVYLKLMLLKRILGTAILAISVFCFTRVSAIVFACLIIEAIAIIINAFPNKKLLNYSFSEQLKDILPNLGISIIMGAIVYLTSYFNFSNIVILSIQGIVGIVVFILLSIIFKNQCYIYIKKTLKKLIKKKN